MMLWLHAFTRSDIVVALGGGVTGDSRVLPPSFTRIGYIQIPSTFWQWWTQV